MWCDLSHFPPPHYLIAVYTPNATKILEEEQEKLQAFLAFRSLHSFFPPCIICIIFLVYCLEDTDEEHSLNWLRTPAGETATHQCPAQASG